MPASLIAQYVPEATLGRDKARPVHRYPSFYFPQPLYSQSNDAPFRWHPAPSPMLHDAANIVTVVEVQVDPENTEPLRQYAHEFARTPLHFIHLRYPDLADLRIHVNCTLLAPVVRGIVPQLPWRVHSWPDAASPEHIAKQLVLANLAKQAGHDVSPIIAIAHVPDDVVGGAIDPRPLLVGYLPTEALAPFDVQVQADFLLGTARRAVAAGRGTPVERYNAALLETAGRLHVDAVASSIGVCFADSEGPCSVDKQQVPPDPFRLLTPRPSAAAPMSRAVETALGIGDGWSQRCWQRWGKLAAAWFGLSDAPKLRSRDAYGSFWAATECWYVKILHRRDGRLRATHRAELANYIIGAIRDADAAVIPSVSGEDTVVCAAMSVPPTYNLRERKRPAVRVLVRSAHAEDSGAEYPRLLIEAKRLVTSFRPDGQLFAQKASVTGLSTWTLWDILTEVRQPRTPVDDARPLIEAESQQWQLLAYVFALWITPPATKGGRSLAEQDRYRSFLWRLVPDETNAAAGRALATLWLPLIGGGWLPACQVTIPGADGEAPWLDAHAESVVAGILDIDTLTVKIAAKTPGKISDFVAFIGASPFVPVVEGSEDRVAQRQEQPPPLDPDIPGGGVRLARWLLSPASLAGSDASQGAVLLDAMWTRLGTLGLAEITRCGRNGASLLDRLLRDEWYPCAGREGDHDVPTTNAGMPWASASESVALVAPIAVVRGDSRLRAERLPRVARPSEAGPRQFLEALQIGAITHDTPAPKLRGLLEALAASDGGIPPHPDAPDRQAFRELYRGLLERMLTNADDDAHLAGVPLLVASPAGGSDKVTPSIAQRGWKWVRRGGQSGDGVIAVCGRRAMLRDVARVFPQVPTLAVAVDGSSRLEASGSASNATLRQSVMPALAGIEPIQPASDRARLRLEQLVPALLALAEVDTRLHNAVDPSVAAERWSKTEVLRVKDTWLNYRLEVGGVEYAAPDRQGEYGDVFTHTEGTGASVRRYILFDVDRPDDPAASPPLRRFHRAMAEVLLGDVRFDDRFAQALIYADFENDAKGLQLAQYLAECGATPELVRAMAAQFHPLSAEKRTVLARIVAGVLKEHGLRLLDVKRSIIPSNLATLGRPVDIDEATLAEVLTRACNASGLMRWAPSVRFCDDHSRTWRRWLTAHRQRLHRWLIEWAHDIGARDVSEFARRLDELIAAAPGRAAVQLQFSPAQVAIELLQTVVETPLRLTTKELESWMPTSKVAPVAQILTAEESGWQAGRWCQRQPSHSTLEPPDAAAEEARRKKLLSIGADGEEALLGLAVSRTLAALRSHAAAAWHVLESTLRGKTGAKRLRAAKAAWTLQPDGDETRHQLQRALHVADYWWAAGFDIVLLDPDCTAPEPIFWEVKTVCKDLPRDIHLSENERAVARRTLNAGRRWHLLAVIRNDKESVAVDVTSVFKQLILEQGDDHPLYALSQCGAVPDGLILRLG